MIKFVQISDSHLFPEPESSLSGVDTRQSFLNVIRHIQTNYTDCQFLLHTGDLAQVPVVSVYR
ncbi:MAG: metallophosphatase, partial [Gammaproteobacteria bacterium]